MRTGKGMHSQGVCKENWESMLQGFWVEGIHGIFCVPSHILGHILNLKLRVGSEKPSYVPAARALTQHSLPFFRREEIYALGFLTLPSTAWNLTGEQKGSNYMQIANPFLSLKTLACGAPP
jgi:hypothetical protein